MTSTPTEEKTTISIIRSLYIEYQRYGKYRNTILSTEKSIFTSLERHFLFVSGQFPLNTPIAASNPESVVRDLDFLKQISSSNLTNPPLHRVRRSLLQCRKSIEHLCLGLWSLVPDMFSEVRIVREVTFTVQDVKRDGPVTRAFIASRLMKNLLDEKASKFHGYFLAVTNVKCYGRTLALDDSGNIKLSVVLNCRTFVPVREETLHGVVYRVIHNGVFLRCGPLKYAYLSRMKMPSYQYIPGENPAFVNEELARIEKHVVVCFSVLAVRWTENSKTRDFELLASIDGDSLGPVSLCGSNEFDMLATTDDE